MPPLFYLLVIQGNRFMVSQRFVKRPESSKLNPFQILRGNFNPSG